MEFSSTNDPPGSVGIDIAVTLSLFLLTFSCGCLIIRTLMQAVPIILRKFYQGIYFLPLVVLMVIGTVIAYFTMFLVVVLIVPQSTKFHQKKTKILYIPNPHIPSPSKYTKQAPSSPSPYFTSTLPIGGTSPSMSVGPWSNTSKVFPEERGASRGVQKLSTIVVEGGLTTRTSPMSPIDPIPGPSDLGVVASAIRTGKASVPAMATAIAEPLSLSPPAFSEGIDNSQPHNHHHSHTSRSHFFGIKIGIKIP